jgi:hypothetical protein
MNIVAMSAQALQILINHDHRLYAAMARSVERNR